MKPDLVRASATVALLVGLALSPALTGPALAQDQGNDLSSDDLKKQFENQKTRGLVLATPGNPSAPDAAVADSTTTATAGTAATDIESMATAFAPEDQVNINVSFDFDSAALRSDQRPKLTTLCTALKAADVQSLRILGHTDAAGSDEYNENLSRLRAEEVKRFLAADCGFPVDRMEAFGVGERFPFDAENPDADVNRRVEFQALS